MFVYFTNCYMSLKYKAVMLKLLLEVCDKDKS